MTPAEMRKARDLLAKARKASGTAERCYTRYMWRPATETGRRELERYNKWSVKADQLFEEVDAMLAGTTDGP